MHHPVINCPKCQGLMEQGFIVDYGDSGYKRPSNWIEGEPNSSFWHNGLKTKDKARYRINSFRCANCGFLESYAIEEGDGDSIFN